MSQQINEEIEVKVCGVAGRMVRVNNGARKAGCWTKQSWVSERRTKTVDGEKILMHAEVRFDDNCGNGLNSFAITGHGWYDTANKIDWDFCGCCHEEIAKVFPELAHLIKWHLFDSNSPMHYVANTVYHASNLDRGKAKGEPNRWENRLQFGAWPITVKMETAFLTWLFAALSHRKTTPVSNPQRPKFEVVEVAYVPKAGGSDYQFGPNYSLDNYTTDWYKAPFKNKLDADEFVAAIKQVNDDLRLVEIVTGWSEGKERNLKAARSTAAWPDATDEQLMLPAAELTKLLEARLPDLMADFKADVQEAGFLWERPA